MADVAVPHIKEIDARVIVLGKKSPNKIWAQERKIIDGKKQIKNFFRAAYCLVKNNMSFKEKNLSRRWTVTGQLCASHRASTFGVRVYSSQRSYLNQDRFLSQMTKPLPSSGSRLYCSQVDLSACHSEYLGRVMRERTFCQRGKTKVSGCDWQRA